MKKINRGVTCACILSVALLLITLFSHAQEAEKFVAKRADWEPFLGQWEGKWDATWPVRFIIRESADGKIEMYYAYKQFVTDDDFISNKQTNHQMVDKCTVEAGSIRLLIPKEGDDGNTLLGSYHGDKGVLRTVLSRTK